MVILRRDYLKMGGHNWKVVKSNIKNSEWLECRDCGARAMYLGGHGDCPEAQQVESEPCDHDWILHDPRDNLEQCSRCNLYRDRPFDSDGFWVDGAALEGDQ